MRKTQFALAALALVASTAALADGVKVYGTADVSVVRTTTTSMAGQGNSAGSIFGVTASEDLGGGLKASANLELGFSGTNGQLGNGGTIGSTTIFNRLANVGISNENLGLTLGTNISPFIVGELTGSTGVGGNGVFVPGLFILNGGNLAGVSYNGGSTGGFFVPDAVTVSGSFNGVSASVMGTTSKVDTTAKYTAAQVGTSFSGLNVNLAYQDMTNVGVKTTNTVLSGNMSFGDLRINGAFASNENAGNSNNGYLLGASMPLAGALSGGLTYASNKDSGLGNMSSISLQYTLSKSTFAYATYNKFSKSIAVLANDSGLGGGDSIAIIGMAHSF